MVQKHRLSLAQELPLWQHQHKGESESNRLRSDCYWRVVPLVRYSSSWCFSLKVLLALTIIPYAIRLVRFQLARLGGYRLLTFSWWVYCSSPSPLDYGVC